MSYAYVGHFVQGTFLSVAEKSLSQWEKAFHMLHLLLLAGTLLNYKYTKGSGTHVLNTHW